jgi:hypothetical protein
VTRLIRKELLSAKWILLLTALGIVIALLIGDPLCFRGDEPTQLSFWLLVPAFILGLRAYSGELRGDTVRFLSSRPVKWWQIWIAKALAGLIATSGIFVFAGLAYAVTVPAVYRPFLVDGLRNGFVTMLPQVAAMFGLGFVVSVLMPGIALSFAALVGVVLGFSMPFAIIEGIADRTSSQALWAFVEAAGQNTFFLGCAAALIACILVARKLPKLDARERWSLWLKPMAGAFILACILGAFGVGLIPSSDGEFVYATVLSPDGRWAVAQISGRKKVRHVLVDTRKGSRVLSWGDMRAYSWSPDSSRFAFTTPDDSLRILSVSPKPAITRLAGVGSVRPKAQDARRDETNSAVAWSPSGREIAVIWEYDVPRKVIFAAAVVAPDTRDVRTIKELPWKSYMETLPSSGDGPILLSSDRLYWPSERGFSEFESTFRYSTSGG